MDPDGPYSRGMKIKLIASVVGASAMLLGLTACGAPSEGVVHDKRYSAASSYSTNDCIRYETRRNSDGTSGSSYCVQYQTNWHYIPASYALDIYSQDGEKHGWKNVTKHEYNSLKVGDWYGSDKDQQGSKGGGF